MKKIESMLNKKISLDQKSSQICDKFDEAKYLLGLFEKNLKKQTSIKTFEDKLLAIRSENSWKGGKDGRSKKRRSTLVKIERMRSINGYEHSVMGGKIGNPNYFANS